MDKGLRCPNEECRQALYVELDGISFITEAAINLIENDKLVRCPICDEEFPGKDWKACWKDPQPFTFCEKDQLCRCGGEYVQSLNINTVTAVKGFQQVQLPLICEDCNNKPNQVVYNIPTLKELKKIRRLI